MATTECFHASICSQQSFTCNFTTYFISQAPLPLLHVYKKKKVLNYTKKWPWLTGKHFGWEISHFVLHDSWFGIVQFSNKHDYHSVRLLVFVSKASGGGHFLFTLKRFEQQSNLAKYRQNQLMAYGELTAGRSSIHNDCTYCRLLHPVLMQIYRLHMKHVKISGRHMTLQSEFIRLNPIVKFLSSWNFHLLSVHRSSIITSFLCSLGFLRLLP